MAGAVGLRSAESAPAESWLGSDFARTSTRTSTRTSRSDFGSAFERPGPPDWAALMASTSWAFFMEPAPLMPRPPAIDFRSASSMVLSPPDFFFGVAARLPAAEVVGSMVSVT